MRHGGNRITASVIGPQPTGAEQRRPDAFARLVAGRTDLSGIKMQVSDYNVLLGYATCEHCKQKVKISKPDKVTNKVTFKNHAALLQIKG